MVKLSLVFDADKPIVEATDIVFEYAYGVTPNKTGGFDLATDAIAGLLLGRVTVLPDTWRGVINSVVVPNDSIVLRKMGSSYELRIGDSDWTIGGHLVELTPTP